MQLQDNVIRFDWAIKRILRNKADHSILNGFLTVVLGQKIEIVEILESESNMDHDNDKFNRVDIKAKDSHGDLILIEVQNTRELHLFQRLLYGTSKAISEHISLGEDYSNVKKVYSISIVYFSLGKGKDYVYHGTTEFRGVHDQNDILHLTDRQRQVYGVTSPADIFPEYYILRVDDFDKVAASPLDEWIAFLKSSKIPASYTAPGLQEAREQLQIATLSPEEFTRYKRRVEREVEERSYWQTYHIEGMMEGEEKGLEKGRQEGAKIKAIEIAQKMRGMGMGIEQIALATGLSEEELKSEKTM